MSATITDSDRAAAHTCLARRHHFNEWMGCKWGRASQHVADCRAISQAIADAREAATIAERTACVEWVRDAEGYGVANDLVAARAAP